MTGTQDLIKIENNIKQKILHSTLTQDQNNVNQIINK